VGLARLPHQNSARRQRQGAHLTLMVAGQPGCGKSTFINTLFGTPLLAISQPPPPTSQVKLHRFDLEENGFRLRLTAIDTPGFGAAIDNRQAWLPLVDVVENSLRSHVFQAHQPDRSELLDMRIHCCLYFIVPSGNLTPLDIHTLQELSVRVNLIPVLAKCDTLSHDDMLRFKKLVRQVLRVHSIPVCGLVLDAVVLEKIAAVAPYAVMGASSVHTDQAGRPVRGRKYKWGMAEVDNCNYCDFAALKSILLTDHLLDLVEATEAHYETIRSQCLSQRWVQASKIDRNLSITNPNYESLAQKVRQGFDQHVAAEELRFKAWKNALLDKQELMNQELLATRTLLLKVQAEVEALQ
ncbi:Septin-domain-containing protein, partial [Suhomyces tanzawaensis NRRL Y-17324]